jgi:hypothetical protein
VRGILKKKGGGTMMELAEPINRPIFSTPNSKSEY